MKTNQPGILLRTRSGAFDIEAYVLPMGDDLLVSVWGGDGPHIGAVAMAQPRPSLQDSRELSSTASVFTYLGHKEDELVKQVAETLSKKLNKKVVVAAGIHWHGISEADIQQVMKNSRDLIHMILETAVG